MYNHNCQLDAAPSPGALAQGLGRTVRVGQLLAVEDFQFDVPNSFQSRMLTQMIQKMIPGAIGELAMDIATVDDVHSVFAGDEVVCPEMFFIDRELVSTLGARITSQHKPLTAEELVVHIIETFRGEIIDASEEWTMAQLEEFDFDFESPDIPAILEAAPSQNIVFTAKIEVSFQKSSSL
ncbi:hypothetical protein B0J14DRAFT_586955 [Halenospora varia]|nr:hypothetical protein B0J14DRAFT_586955 [Halenospora varia]